MGRPSGRAADSISVNVDEHALLGVLVGQHEHVPDVHQIVREVSQVENVIVRQDERGSVLYHVAVALRWQKVVCRQGAGAMVQPGDVGQGVLARSLAEDGHEAMRKGAHQMKLLHLGEVHANIVQL